MIMCNRSHASQTQAMKKFVSSALLLTAVFTMLFCKKTDPEPDCGCDGPTEVQLRNVRAVHEGAGLFTFQDPRTHFKVSAWACDADSAWAPSADRELPNYTLSGNLKKACSPGPTFTIVFPSIDLSEVRKD